VTLILSIIAQTTSSMKKNFLTTTTMASAGLSAFNFGCSNVTKNEGSGVVADIAVNLRKKQLVAYVKNYLLVNILQNN
jgi:hypothetical protein